MSSSISKYSYDVFLQLGTLTLSVRFPCKVGIIWQSFMQSLQAESKPDLIKGTSYLQETLSSNMTLEYNLEKNKFAPKMVNSYMMQNTIKILLYTEKGVREAGQIEFDLATVLNNKMTEMTMEMKLDKCPDRSAKISFCIRMIKKEEVRVQGSFVEGMVGDIAGVVKKSQKGRREKEREGQFPPLPPSQNQHNMPSLLSQPITVPQIVTPSPVNLPQYTTHHSSSHIDIKIIPPPAFKPTMAAPIQPSYKQQRDILVLENSKLNSLLQQTQFHFQTLKIQLMQCSSQNQTLHRELSISNLQITDLRVKNDELTKMEEMYRDAQQELIVARTQLARIFNAATDLGGIVLTDRLQSAIGIQEQEFPEQQINEQEQSQYQVMQYQTYEHNQCGIHNKKSQDQSLYYREIQNNPQTAHQLVYQQQL